MTEFRQKILDVRTWQPIEGLEAQGSVFRNTGTTNLKYINNDLAPSIKVRSSPIRLLDDTSPGQLLESTLEVLGLAKSPRDMGDHHVSANDGWNALSRACEVISMGAPCSKIASTSRNFPAFPVTNTVPKI